MCRPMLYIVLHTASKRLKRVEWYTSSKAETVDGSGARLYVVAGHDSAAGRHAAVRSHGGGAQLAHAPPRHAICV